VLNLDKQNSITGVLVVIFGTLIIWVANGYGLRGLSPDPLGPSVYPKALGAALVVLGVILTVVSFKNRRKPEEENKPFLQSGGKRVLAILAAGLIYAVVLETIGYIICTVALILVIMIVTGERNKKKLAITSVSISIGLYFAFTELFMVLLPSGFLF
jgi:putative tricarboxylic transport membrane protein